MLMTLLFKTVLIVFKRIILTFWGMFSSSFQNTLFDSWHYDEHPLLCKLGEKLADNTATLKDCNHSDHGLTCYRKM